MTQENDAKFSSNQPKGKPFFNLSPWGNFRLGLFIVVITFALIGFIFDGLVEQNTKVYWKFVENVTPTDIEKIEVQRIDFNDNGIGELIVVKEIETISSFTSALKTVQPYQPNAPVAENKARVKVWLKDGRTIEFVSYTIEGESGTVFVGDVFIKPNLYAFGNGHAQFPGSNLYEWLINIGIEIQ